MKKKILLGIMTVALVTLLAGTGIYAYFSDTEKIGLNTITVGTLDIEVVSEPFELDDIKPCYTLYEEMTIDNVGDNPVSIYKRITDIECFENGKVEPEQEWYAAHPGQLDGNNQKNDIDGVIDVDIFVEIFWGSGESYSVTILDGTEGVSIRNLQNRIYLGLIPVGGYMVVTESYHMRASVGNWAQSDKIRFNVEYIGEQLNGELVLENKDADGWYIIDDDMYGELTYNVMGATFDYTFNGYGLDDVDYSLIYYPDPWPGNNLIVIDSGTASGGTLALSGSVDIGSIPIGTDVNPGAKIWLVLSSDVGATMTAWNPTGYLFETALIEYTDTG
jgi:predicted ribosomally synthesized peptide with SipW-like signal peptide